MYVPESPTDLCRLLRTDPDEAQAELMERLARSVGKFDVRGTDRETVRAALMVVLWRVLRVPGSSATVVAPSAPGTPAAGEAGHEAMEFLAEVCKTTDCVLSSITVVRAWHRLAFGSEEGWGIRFCHNVPSIVAESASRSLTGLVIDAGNAETDLGESARALETVLASPRGLLIRLW